MPDPIGESHDLASYDLLRQTLDSATDAIFVKDLQGRFIVFNRAAETITGKPVAEVIGKTVYELFGQALGDNLRQAELAVVDTGMPCTREESIPTVNGVRQFLVTRSPYRDKDGRIVGVLGISRDISDLRETEQKLRDSDERWKFAVDGAGDGIWDWDVNTGRVFYSPQWKSMLGYAEDEVGDTTDAWSSRIHPDDVERCWKAIEDHFTDGSAHFVIEHRMRAKDGGWRWVLDRGKVVQRAADGRPIRVIGTHTDITERKLTEQALLLERERLRLATGVAGLGVWEYQVETETFKSDETCYQIYGLDPASGALDTFKGVAARWHPDDLALIGPAWKRELPGRTGDRSTEVRIIRPSGEIRWLQIVTRAMPATALSSPRLVGVIRDITDAHLAEEKLRRSYESLGRAEKIAGIGSWTLDLASGAFHTSDKLYEMNGADSDGPPLTPEDLERMMPPEDFQRVSACIARCAETGESYDVDVRHFRPDGSSFAAHIRGEAQRDATGRIIALTGTVQDVSEREEARLRLQSLADNLPNGAIFRVQYSADGAGDLVYFSAGAYALLGLPVSQVIDLPAMMGVIHPEDRSTCADTIRAALERREGYDCIVRIGGSEPPRMLRLRASPSAVRPGGASVWDGIMLDVTEEHRIAEELVRAKELAEAGERAKAAFLATMSHEIRTPMNSVIGMTQLIRQTNLTDRHRNYIDKIDLSARALLGIINDILDYSKIDAGMLTLEDTGFELDEVLETVSAATAIRAEEKGLEIVYAIAPDVPRHLRGDPLRLGQVLTNLVSNAVKFTEQGDVVVRIGQAVRERDTIRLTFSVEDTGVGIDPDTLRHLFRPFTQATEGTSRRYGGTGLGLAISKQLVELMGGQIDARSTPGVGSTFCFTVPMKQAPLERAHRVEDRRHLLAGVRAMIVDDNDSARVLLSDMVGHLGVTVDTAAGGDEALVALDQMNRSGQAYDIVLVDWRMPGMDGLEVARRIRANERLKHMPAILMVTAYGREEVLQRASEIGLAGVLIKPVTESVMFNTLAEILCGPHAADRAKRPPASDRPAVHPAMATLAGLRVLLVDDNELNREVATDFLQLVGVDVVAAADGQQALDCLAQARFDVVLMDVQMPVMDGIEATRRIRQHPQWSAVPVIALTAQVRSEDRALFAAAGMNGHISKPIDEDVLYDTIAAVVEDRGRPSPPLLEIDDGAASAFERVDLAGMMARFGENGERVHRVLRGFLRDFSNAPARVTMLADGQDRDALMLCMHTMKSSLRYLGAESTARLAHDAEGAAKEGRMGDLQALIPVLADDLRIVIREAQRAMAAVAVQPASLVRMADLIEDLTELKQLVSRSDYRAMDVFDRVAGAIQTPHRPLLDGARDAFDDLDRQAALHLIEQLLQRLRDGGS